MQQTPVSISPSGEQFPLPSREEYAAEFARLEALAAEQRKAGREIVVVVGLGFVGAVMAAVVADATDKKGRPTKFVIGMQRPSGLDPRDWDRPSRRDGEDSRDPAHRCG